jgi:biotin transport system substrate-specific component
MSALPLTRRVPGWLVRALRILFFAALVAISAKIAINAPGTPVPITLQTLAVLLTGFALGPLEGAVSIAAYLGLIAGGVPVDARSLGSAALVSPTAGYLLGFVPGVIIAGLAQPARRHKMALMLLTGGAAIAVIYVCGAGGLYRVLGTWPAAIMAGVIPFIFVDFGKVLLAAALVRLGRESWLRWFVKSQLPGA